MKCTIQAESGEQDLIRSLWTADKHSLASMSGSAGEAVTNDEGIAAQSLQDGVSEQEKKKARRQAEGNDSMALDKRCYFISADMRLR